MGHALVYCCECATHGIEIDRDENLGEVTLVIWTRSGYLSGGRRIRWRDRLRDAWRIISRGRAIEEEIILDQSHADALARALLRPGLITRLKTASTLTTTTGDLWHAWDREEKR